MRQFLLATSAMVTMAGVSLMVSPASAALVCGGGTCSETVSIGPLTTDFSSEPLTINDFNPATGTLTGVTITLGGSLASNGTLQNTSETTESFHFRLTEDLTIAGGPPPLNAAGLDASYVGPNTMYTLSSLSSTPFSAGASLTPAIYTAAPADLADFVGTGTFTVDGTSLTGETFSGGGGNVKANLTTTATETVTVEYSYTAPPPPPVNSPEPASLAMLGVGLFGLGMARRRRK